MASVDAQHAPAFAVSALVSSVYALAPFDLVSTSKMPVQIPNRTGLAAGSAVEFVAMGDQVFLDPFTGGLPIVAALGHVSADGLTVATDPGEGLLFLTWFGVRPRGA